MWTSKKSNGMLSVGSFLFCQIICIVGEKNLTSQSGFCNAFRKLPTLLWIINCRSPNCLLHIGCFYIRCNCVGVVMLRQAYSAECTGCRRALCYSNACNSACLNKNWSEVISLCMPTLFPARELMVSIYLHVRWWLCHIKYCVSSPFQKHWHKIFW